MIFLSLIKIEFKTLEAPEKTEVVEVERIGTVVLQNETSYSTIISRAHNLFSK